ncbi:hypothetical protein [Streptomyces sp. DSM 15324]|uniref:hypothetical protein n=1 Tax=Streptomyces sp. DSM 15324 TaxID=1739111 RepID=UPI000747E516|nr:hypothetical protein [Streptomyces sp. DSM 15324]KUO08983.1 hypothetical protein AQJ58_26695 [Streptomyces sp. DSM 15324]
MDEEACLDRYGVHPAEADLDDIRRLLGAQIARERQAQGAGDTELMRLCCVQLFNAGGLDDVLLIWDAKTASMDADCSIDIQLLCGTGLAGTKAYLRSRRRPDAAAALRRLLVCEQAGDFEDFSVAGYSTRYAAYYAP